MLPTLELTRRWATFGFRRDPSRSRWTNSQAANSRCRWRER